MGDYSDSYTGKVGQIKFSRGARSVEFKPFLTSLNVKRAVKDQSSQVIEGFMNVRKIPYSANMPDYKMSFVVPSSNVDEAKANHKKMQTFFRIMYPASDSAAKGNAGSETKFLEMYVQFGNLINQGSVFGASGKTKVKVVEQSVLPASDRPPLSGSVDVSAFNEILGGAIESAAENTPGMELFGVAGGEMAESELVTVREHQPKGPLRVVCRNLKYKPDLSMGFFEFNGMLYAKVFDISLTFESNDQVSLNAMDNLCASAGGDVNIVGVSD